ncbi:MAG: hypothetical protein IJ165_00815 [Proteobacteria bacterium]|nr:hypothetical protein [Pseudomonadota bacterium]
MNDRVTLFKKILDFFTNMPEARLFDNIIQRHIIYSSPRFSLCIFIANAAGALQTPSSLERITWGLPMPAAYGARWRAAMLRIRRANDLARHLFCAPLYFCCGKGLPELFYGGYR